MLSCVPSLPPLIWSGILRNMSPSWKRYFCDSFPQILIEVFKNHFLTSSKINLNSGKNKLVHFISYTPVNCLIAFLEAPKFYHSFVFFVFSRNEEVYEIWWYRTILVTYVGTSQKGCKKFWKVNPARMHFVYTMDRISDPAARPTNAKLCGYQFIERVTPIYSLYHEGYVFDKKKYRIGKIHYRSRNYTLSWTLYARHGRYMYIIYDHAYIRILWSHSAI